VVFSTGNFLFVFLPIALVIYFGIARLAADHTIIGVSGPTFLLLCISLAFYMTWHWAYVFLLMASVTVTVLAAPHVVPGNPRARLFLTGSIIIHLSVLGYYKYLDFLGSSAAYLMNLDWVEQHILLPLGISFFTFQQISYLIDVRNGHAAVARWSKIATYICFFPQLIAGPIVRFSQVAGRLAAPRLRPTVGDVLGAVVFFSMGLFKKSFLADHLALYADPVFATVASGAAVNTVEAAIGTLSFTFQIFFDFCGYSEMAIGLGYLFGFRLPINFDHPYRALSIIDFWRRWHITLSMFFRDYVYIPLGGSKGGQLLQIRNVLFVMLLSGLWHGAAWAFVIWGGLHGLLLALAIGWRWVVEKLPMLKIPVWLGWLLTFVAVTLLWIPFRAETLDGTLAVLTPILFLDNLVLPFGAESILNVMGFPESWKSKIIYSNSGTVGPLQALGLASGFPILPLAALVAFFMPSPVYLLKQLENWKNDVALGVTVLVALTVSVFTFIFSGAPQVFVYFQF